MENSETKTKTKTIFLPKEYAQTMETLERKMKQLKETIDSINKFHSMKSEMLRREPTRVVERELWIDFLMNPERLQAIIQEAKSHLSNASVF